MKFVIFVCWYQCVLRDQISWFMRMVSDHKLKLIKLKFYLFSTPCNDTLVGFFSNELFVINKYNSEEDPIKKIEKLQKNISPYPFHSCNIFA